jgi:hypothetical protein
MMLAADGLSLETALAQSRGTAKQRALRIPEVLYMIFKKLNRGSQVSALRVCRSWLDVASCLVWRDIPFDALSVRSGLDPVYARAIRCIHSDQHRIPP